MTPDLAELLCITIFLAVYVQHTMMPMHDYSRVNFSLEGVNGRWRKMKNTNDLSNCTDSATAGQEWESVREKNEEEAATL